MQLKKNLNKSQFAGVTINDNVFNLNDYLKTIHSCHKIRFEKHQTDY